MKKMKKMKKDISRYLPSEIITEILARLPAQYILRCKCVCKSWYRLFETYEFAKLHLSKAVPGLALTIKLNPPNSIDKTIQLTNVLDDQHHNLDDLHFSTITNLYFRHYRASIQGSADGLLLLEMKKHKNSEHNLYLCNPITRECIDLLHSHSQQPIDSSKGLIMYGFGVTKKTGKYKAVSILYNQAHQSPECKVYTIGTGLWRSITPHVAVHFYFYESGVFVNGNLHWLVRDSNGTPCISCFDLETELFSTFSLPPLTEDTRSDEFIVGVEGNLCVCEWAPSVDSKIIWLMKEYGVDKSWTKECIIRRGVIWSLPLLYPVKVSVDGIILMEYDHDSVHYYSNKNKTIQSIRYSRGGEYTTSFSHTPSFISLTSFGMEKSVSLF